MSEKTYEQKYNEQTKICDEKIAIIQPFLKQLAEQNDEGTGFYEDVTVLRGPGGAEYNHFRDNMQNVFESWKRGKISIFNIKWSGLSFVLEYKLLPDAAYVYKGAILTNPVYVPTKAYMVYKHQTQPVSLELAKAVKDLHSAQEYRGALYGCMMDSRLH
ncbi:MAG: hypothetical protein J6S57_02935 [Alphaproteobacteria bacterium]|nr:hypothetical protein [Alphaproteobacteria bacterium]